MVIRHVFVKFKDRLSTAKEREQVVRESRAVAEMPGVLNLSIGLPADAASEKAWDIALTLRFDSVEAVEAYRVDPAHKEYVDKTLRPRMAVIKAWNFEIR